MPVKTSGAAAAGSDGRSRASACARQRRGGPPERVRLAGDLRDEWVRKVS